MSQSLAHAAGSLPLPHIVTADADGRNGDSADSAIGQTEVFGILGKCGGIGQQNRAAAKRNAGSQHTGAAAYTVTAGHTIDAVANDTADALLEVGEDPLFHDAGLSSGEHTIGQLGNLIINQIGAAVIITGVVGFLVGGGGIEVGGVNTVEGVVCCTGTDRHGGDHRHDQQGHGEKSFHVGTSSIVARVSTSNSCQSPGLL